MRDFLEFKLDSGLINSFFSTWVGYIRYNSGLLTDKTNLLRNAIPQNLVETIRCLHLDFP